MSEYFTLGTIISVLTSVGVVFVAYFNLKKIGDNIRQETEWRAKINVELRKIADEVTKIKLIEQDIHTLIKRIALLESIISVDQGRIKEIIEYLRSQSNNQKYL